MRIREGFILRRVADVPVIVAVGKARETFKGMMNLNSTGECIWKCLEKGMSTDEILYTMLERYEVKEEKARADLDTFLGRLKEVGAIDELEK